MALLFMDGFDHYNYNGTAQKKWDNPIAFSGYTSGASSGRFSTGGVSPNGSGNLFCHQWAGMNKTFVWTPTPPSELIIGFAAKFDFTSEVHPFLQILGDNGRPQVQFWLDAIGGDIKLVLADPAALAVPVSDTPFPTGTLIANTGFVPPIGLWFYFETKILFSTGSTGRIDIQLDSTPFVSITNIKTSNTGTSYFKGWRITGLEQFSSGFTIDDLYIADNLPGNITDFVGEVRVQTMYPDAEGFQNDFFPSTGTNNATNVNLARTNWTETTPTAKYNFSGTINAIDLYSIGNYTIAGTIFGVQANLSHRKDDVGARRVAPILRTGGNIYVGDDVPQYSDYTWAGHIWEENPALALPWTLTELNQAEFGIKIVS
jgi:hypothetical protein